MSDVASIVIEKFNVLMFLLLQADINFQSCLFPADAQSYRILWGHCHWTWVRFLYFNFLQLFMVSCYQTNVRVSRYVECTSSAIEVLTMFKKLYPGHRRREIEVFIENAVRYLENVQTPDGSWYIPPLNYIIYKIEA